MMQVTMELTAEMLVLAGRASAREEALALLQEKLDSGEAFEKFKEMVSLQGGDTSVLDDLKKLPQAEIVEPLTAESDGFVTEVDADGIGRAVLILGGGRVQFTDSIDHAVGISELCKIGDRVEKGQQLLLLHANDSGKLAEAKKMAMGAVAIADEAVSPPELIVETIRPENL
jgi:thymidine phosphorylase